jgi:hypothetical protein
VARKPWLDRKDWRDRWIVSETGLVGTLLLSLLYLIVIVGGAVFVMVLVFAAGFPRLALVFGAASVALGLALLWRRILRSNTLWSRVQLRCRLETLPGVMGGWLKATVQATGLPSRPKLAAATLSCTVSAGRNIRCVWKGTQDVSAKLEHAGALTRVPVRFKVPFDLPESRRAHWALLVSFTLPGGDVYSGSFAVPVYETKDAPPEEQQAEDVQTEEDRPGKPIALKLR